MALEISRQYLKFVDDELIRLWRLGRNAVVAWSPTEEGLDVLAVPQYLLPNLFNNHEEILVGSMQRSKEELALISDICEIEPYRIVIPSAIRSNSIGTRALEYLTRRFGITKLASKAVVLFDIVGFSRYSPLEQVTALNSLSYSINVAYQRTVENGLDVSLCHSTTGDGFYVWNRAEGVDANIDLFCFLMLVLADNSLGQRKGIATTVPVLRTGFHVGDCYEYFLAEGSRPGTGSYIVGNATIQLARMVEIALQNQILIGDFNVAENTGAAQALVPEGYDAAAFLEKAQKRLLEFKDVNLSREKVSGIKCYLTGHAEADGKFNICRYRFSDKHDFQHSVFNAKVNVYRASNEQIFLGRMTKDLEDFAADEIVIRPDTAIVSDPVVAPITGTAE